MSKDPEKVLCRTPTPNRQPTRIDKNRFDLVRKTMLRVVPSSGDGVLFSDLPMLVENQLNDKERALVGSIMWNVTTVKLELEVRGEIERIPGSKPQRLRRTKVRAQ